MSLTYTRRGSDGKPLATTATVVQYHYLDWPDYGVPTNAASILALINAANEVCRPVSFTTVPFFLYPLNANFVPLNANHP